MGVIQKQSTRSSVLIYIGIAIGFLNSALLLPKFFSPEEIGMLGFLNSFTSLFSIAASFGIPLITIKLFPEFRSESLKHHGFFGFVFLTSLIGIGLGLSFYGLFSEYLISDKNSASSYPLFGLMFAILFASRVLFRNYDSYVRMLYHSVTGAFLENVFLKIATLIVLAIVILKQFSFDGLFIGFAIASATPGIGILLYSLRFNNGLNPRPLFRKMKDRKRELYTIGIFGMLGSLGSIIVLEVDRLMISNMLGLEANGIYTIAFFFGVFVSTPSRGLKRIAQVVISESWKNNDMANVLNVYKKSCINQLLISSYLLLCIWFGIDYLFQYMQPEFAAGKYVILFIGIAQVVDMGTGVNNEIIVASPHYRYNSYFTASLIGLVILLNYLLIPIWGIEGAAFASLAAMSLINLLRFLLLYIKYGFQPYTVSTAFNLTIVIIIYGLMFLVPQFENPVVGILLNGMIITVLFWIPTYFLNLSPDLNNLIDRLLVKIRIRKS